MSQVQIRRDGPYLRFTRDGGATWSRWYDTRLEALELRVLHGIEAR